ncbi:MAG: methyltransferase family protein [Candidatus Hodarchaeales archaeon]|jgi:protein-S-isoprenylcysteine O-methyltransferase Ste14
MNNSIFILRIYLIIFALLYFLFFWIGNIIQQKITGLSPYALGVGKKGKEKRIELIFTLVFLLWSIRLIVLFFLPDLFFSEIKWLDSETSQSLGIILMSLGVLMLGIVRFTMKKSWRVGIDLKSDTQLVTNGIFKFSRNPATLSFNLMFLGSYFLTQELILLLLFLADFIFLHLQVLQEEKFLRSRNLDGYSDYTRKVGRYFWKI